MTDLELYKVLRTEQDNNGNPAFTSQEAFSVAFGEKPWVEDTVLD